MSDLTAIDVLIDPDEATMERARAVNARMLQSLPEGWAFGGHPSAAYHDAPAVRAHADFDELDGGGPESRFLAPLEFPDLAFPAQLNPGVAGPGWRPEFFDYLYVGFTDATAFSPTDVMPLARWGKLAMTVQAVCSLMILGLVIARAANILQ